MKLYDLKGWINSLPDEVLNHDVVFRNFMVIENDKENLFAKDVHIAACGIDDATQEAYFCDKESAMILDEGILDGSEDNE